MVSTTAGVYLCCLVGYVFSRPRLQGGAGDSPWQGHTVDSVLLFTTLFPISLPFYPVTIPSNVAIFLLSCLLYTLGQYFTWNPSAQWLYRTV